MNYIKEMRIVKASKSCEQAHAHSSRRQTHFWACAPIILIYTCNERSLSARK